MEGNPDDVSEDSYHSDNLSEDYYSDHLCEDEEVDDYELAASASLDEASPDEASPEGFILFLNSLIYHIDSRMREMRHMEVRPQPEYFQTHSQVRAIFHFRMHLTQSYPAASTELRMAYLMARTVDFDRKNLRQHLFEDLSLQILTMAMQNEHGPALEFLSVFPDASMSVIVRVMMEVLSPPPESILFCFDCLTQVGVQNFLCNGCSLPYYFELEHESLLPHITTGDAEFRFSRGLLPASRTFLESLKPSQATCKEIDKDSVSCSICRVEFELGVNDEILLLPCNHQFHPNCILRWFNERSTCPNCRVVMPLTAHTPLLVPRTSFEVGESSHTTGEIREPNREDVYDTTAPSTSSSSAPSTSGGAEPSHPKEEGGEQDRSATSGRSQQSEPNDKNPNPDESAMQRLHALVANIQELSNVNDISRLHQLLKQAEQSLKAAATQLAHLLSLLDPAQHSLGYLYILDAFISGPKTEEKAGEHVSTVTRFIDSCAQDQIHFAPQKFVSVCKKFKDDVMMLRMSIRGVAPMRTAVRKLQSSSGYLTTLHPEFLTLCLLAKCYKVGYSILEEDIFEFDHPRDVFLYCYYGGMICIGQKDYRKAMELLHNVVTAPMTTLSAIAVQAHRKYILVSLIHNGQLSDSFSKSNSAMTPQTLKKFSQHYYDLADSYSTGKISQLESCLLANRVKFERDNNLGLVKQVVTSLYKRNIQGLTQTYLTLSLQDIADRTQLNTPKEAEMHVLRMIQDGEIYATVNQKDGMITFHEDPEQYKTWSTSEHIESLIQRIMSLSKRLSTVNEYISYDVAYLTKVGKDRPGHDLNDFDGTPHGFGRDRSGFDDFDGVPSDYSHF